MLLTINHKSQFWISFIISITAFSNSIAQICNGSWELQRPLTSQCVTGQWVGWQNTTNPSGCPNNPTYTGVQTNTFSFSSPVNSFYMDFRGFDGQPLCARIEIKINGIFYPLNSTNFFEFPQGSTCTNGSFSYVTLTNDGYLTVSLDGGPGFLGQGRIEISNLNTTSISVSTNDGNGTIFSDPFNCNIVVPLILMSFKASSHQQCKATIKWETGIESNIRIIEIQKSENGLDFLKVGEVAPKGSNSLYSFKTMNYSDSYYRLKIIDLDSSYAFSETIFLSSSCENNSYILFPNPATNQVEIEGLKSSDRIIITDMLGRIVKVYDKPLIQKLDVSSIPMGMYILNVMNGGKHVVTLKMVKK